MAENFYEILGVAENATSDQIKKAYRTLALKYHPDKNEECKKEEAEVIFKNIQEAYKILSNEESRKMYNEYILDQRRPLLAQNIPDELILLAGVGILTVGVAGFIHWMMTKPKKEKK